MVLCGGYSLIWSFFFGKSKPQQVLYDIQHPQHISFFPLPKRTTLHVKVL
jgi:hypothetical protein